MPGVMPAKNKQKSNNLYISYNYIGCKREKKGAKESRGGNRRKSVVNTYIMDTIIPSTPHFSRIFQQSTVIFEIA
jgi:hypothetical protein